MLIRLIALLVTIFVVSLPASALAAEPNSGMIEGGIVNETASGSSSVTDLNVTLKTYLNDAEVGATTTNTDVRGRFVFNGLSIDSDYSYQVVLTFQEAEYYSEWFSFDEGEINKSVDVTVYDSTTSDEAIKVATAHTIIYVGQGSLQVKEYFLFVNESDRTYIGLKEGTVEGNGETLRFSLPKKATELQITLGLMECCIISNEEGFTDTMPVLPGTKEVAYSYKVDHNSGAYTFSQRVNYPIAGFDLLIQAERVEVSADQLTKGEPMDIGGARFNHLSGKDFTPGNILVTRLSGLPQANNQGTILGATLTLVALAAGFGFVYLLRKKRFQPVSPEDSPDQRRQRLLAEIAQLDDDFEGGKILEEVYRRLRAVKKAQLVELIQKSKEESGRR